MNSVIFLSDLLLTVIAIIWLFVATIQDIKKREVANWLSFSLIIFALSLRAIASVISSDARYFLFGVGAMMIFFGIANLFYYARIFAGGDTKLLTAIGTAFATKPFFVPLIKNNFSSMLIFPVNIPFLAVFLFNILFVGSVYGLIFSTVLAFKNFDSFKKEFVEMNRKYFKQTVLFIMLSFLLFIANKLFFSDFAITVSVIMLIVFPFLFVFIKAVENSCMIKLLKPSELTEGDWIFKEIKVGKKVIKPKFEGLSKDEIALLRKANKKVMIKQGVPFVPVFLIALIISFFINIVELLIRSFV